MRIAQVTPLVESIPPQSQNGLEFVVSWITEELVRRGHEVTLFASADSVTQAKLVSLLPKGTNNDLTRSSQSYFNNLNSALAASMGKKFDVIHFHNAEGSCFSPFISIPVVQTLHHPYSHDPTASLIARSELHRATLAPILSTLEKINYVTISDSQLKGFMHAEQHYFKKYQTIHNGIPVEKFSYNEAGGEYLLFIGYINKDKGADAAVRIARKLGMRLILAGNNFGQEKFFDEHIKPYLSEKIQYVGPVDFKQKNELYKNALVKLAPLEWPEPFGLTLVEAQACGTPVIAFSKGAAPEIIIDGKTGFIVDTEDEMAEAVSKISTISRRACRKNVEENFSIAKMVDQYEALYKKITPKDV